MVTRRMMLRRLAGALFIAAPVALAACGGGDDGDGGGGGKKVEVVDVLFRPDELTVKVGDTVTWEWSGRLPHQVLGEFNGAEVKSEKLTGTGTYSFTFTAAGVFDYKCGVHGIGMAGKITVE